MNRCYCLFLLISLIYSLEQRQNKHQYYDPYYSSPSSSNKNGLSAPVKILLCFLVTAACVVGCVLLWRRCRNRNSQPGVLNRFGNNQPIPPQSYYSNYPPNIAYNVPSSNNNNRVYSRNPYETQNLGNSSRQTIFNKNCMLCNLQSKMGEEVVLKINCQNNHCFHLKCLSFKLEGQYPSSQCPICQQNYSYMSKMFCSSCKQNYVHINLKEFLNTEGGLNIDALLGRYGQLCQNCKKS